MNDRRRRIDEFLKYFRDICKQNPNFILSHNNIYKELTRLGLSKQERGESISSHFSEWIDDFKNDDRCNVFVDPSWSYFCQFISNNPLASNSKEHLKVYIPLDSAHIREGATEIFKFLSDNGIPHLSKIGSHSRFDDIVVRLVNPGDVKKLLKFVQHSSIQKGLMTANPFAFSVNGIAMAVDGRLSYNSVVASMIEFYIRNKREQKLLDTVGVDDFYRFVENYYMQVFSDAQGLEKLSVDFDENLDSNRIVNYKNVLELLLKSSQENFTFDDYISHYQECSNKRIQELKIDRIVNMKYYNSKIRNDTKELTNRNQADFEKAIDNMLLYVIDTMTEKYKDQYAVIENVIKYIFTGNKCCITRYNDLRNWVCDSTLRQDLLKLIEEQQIDLRGYIQGALIRGRRNENKSLDSDMNSNANNTILDNQKEKIVLMTMRKIIQIMANKYGKETALNNLEGYIQSGNPKLLTRDFNIREEIVNSSFRINVIEVLKKYGIELSQYLKRTFNIDRDYDIVRPSRGM